MAKKAEKKVANTPSSEEVEAVENAEVAPEEQAEATSQSSEVGSDDLSPLQKQHYDGIIRLNHAVRIAELDYEDAKSEVSAAKRRWEQLQAKLTSLIAQGANPQPELPFPEETAPTEEWKSVAIESVLELTEKQAEKLEEAGIKTVGQFEHLRSGQMDGYPDGLRSLKGVGQKTVDVWEEQIVEWLSANAREAQPAAAAESGGE